MFTKFGEISRTKVYEKVQNNFFFDFVRKKIIVSFKPLEDIQYKKFKNMLILFSWIEKLQ